MPPPPTPARSAAVTGTTSSTPETPTGAWAPSDLSRKSCGFLDGSERRSRCRRPRRGAYPACVRLLASGAQPSPTKTTNLRLRSLALEQVAEAVDLDAELPQPVDRTIDVAG